MPEDKEEKEIETADIAAEESMAASTAEESMAAMAAMEEDAVVEAAIEDAAYTEEAADEIAPAEAIDDISDIDDVQELITVRPVKFQEFELTEPNRAIKKNLDIMQDVSMHISVELGRTKSTIKEVMDMEEGSIVELDKIAGEQVEIYVNEKLVAKGEVIVIEDKFGVRVTSTNLPKQE
ncbi:flagellar motor switch protein FliN [bacterium]|nr:flagellar motor switch protein FliN [bacterium]